MVLSAVTFRPVESRNWTHEHTLNMHYFALTLRTKTAAGGGVLLYVLVTLNKFVSSPSFSTPLVTYVSGIQQTSADGFGVQSINLTSRIIGA